MRLFERLGALSVYLTAFCFITGYAFWVGYYAPFNIELAALEQPFWVIAMGSVDTFLTYINAIMHSICLTLAGVVFYVFLYVAWKWAGTDKECPSKKRQIVYWLVEAFVRIFWLFFAVFVIVVLPFMAGKKSGSDELAKPSTKVTLYFRPNEEMVFPKALRDANKGGKLRLLVQTKDLVLVYVPELPAGAKSRDSSQAAYMINRTGLELVCFVSTSQVSAAPDSTCNSAEPPHLH